MKKTTAEIHKFLREKREEMGITQAEVAKKAGISQAHLSVLENGKFGGSVRTLERVARAIDYDILLYVVPTAQPLIKGLEKLSKGLVFLSETDSPLEVVGPFLVIPSIEDGKKFWIDGTEFDFDKREGWGVGQILQNHIGPHSQNAHRWVELLAFFGENLSEPRAYVFRKKSKNRSRVLVVGGAPGNQFVGVTFEIVET